MLSDDADKLKLLQDTIMYGVHGLPRIADNLARKAALIELHKLVGGEFAIVTPEMISHEQFNAANIAICEERDELYLGELSDDDRVY